MAGAWRIIIDIFREDRGIMPIYQFYCYGCHTAHEVEMKINDLEKYDRQVKKSIKCPECGDTLEKIICPPKVIKIN